MDIHCTLSVLKETISNMFNYWEIIRSDISLQLPYACGKILTQYGLSWDHLPSATTWAQDAKCISVD